MKDEMLQLPGDGLLDTSNESLLKGQKNADLRGRQRQEFDSEEHNPVRRVEEVSNQVHYFDMRVYIKVNLIGMYPMLDTAGKQQSSLFPAYGRNYT